MYIYVISSIIMYDIFNRVGYQINTAKARTVPKIPAWMVQEVFLKALRPVRCSPLEPTWGGAKTAWSTWLVQ